MKIPFRHFFLSSAIVLGCADPCTVVAQETPPAAPPAASVPQPDTAPVPGAPPAAPASVAPPPAPADLQPPPSPETASAAEPAKSADEKAPAAARPAKKSRGLANFPGLVINPGRRGGDRVRIMGDNLVGEKSMIDGRLITVMGDTAMEGVVTGDVISVMGDVVINGTVRGGVFAVMGDVTLGPKARIEGDLVTKMGDLARDEKAVVVGNITQITGGETFGHGLPIFQSWWEHGLSLGRAVPFGPGAEWMWKLSAFSLVVYVLFGLVFPGGIQRSGDMLVRRPVFTVLSPMLALLVLPLLFVLLCVTIVGIPVALTVLPVALVVAVLFGRTAIYGLVGRTISRNRLHPALAVLAGAVLCLGLYLVPLAGLLLWLCVAWLGFGCVIATLFTGEKTPGPDVGVNPVEPSTAPVSAAPALEPVSSAGLPRAGFWVRTAALFIDGIIIALCLGPWAGPAVPPALALYGALLWKFRGATIGGIVCGLQVVRLDDRPLDWPTVVVRALACFLSLVVVGLGFVWVVFDDEKQSWHDKIAGTTVVRPPKRPSLV